MLSLLLLAACGPSAAEEPACGEGNLTVRLEGIRGSDGRVLLAVYANPAAFASDGEAIAWFAVPPATSRLILDGVQRRPVAISAFHDENDDQQLNLKGDFPLEGYGSSGDVGRFDEPDFDDAKIDGDVAVVRFHYLN